MTFTPGSIVKKYTSQQADKTASGFVPGSIVSKYSGQQTIIPQTDTFSDWTGIQNKNTYFKDSWNQLVETIKHPIKTISSAFSAGLQTIPDTLQHAGTDIGEVFKTEGDNWAKNTADVMNALGASASVLFLPMTAIFASAEKLPVLKQGADVVNSVFTAAGKLAAFPAGKFVDVLPIDQEDKDVLKPAFEEIGTLAGQIILGGKVMGKLSKGFKKLGKEEIVKLKTEAITESKTAEQTVLKNKPELKEQEIIKTKIEEPDFNKIVNDAVASKTKELEARGVIAKENIKTTPQTEKNYWYNGQEHKFVEAINEKLVKLPYNFDGFAHRLLNPNGTKGGWSVTESKTGLLVSGNESHPTMKSAIEQTTKNFEKVGEKQIKQLIDDSIKHSGLSPKYQIAKTALEVKAKAIKDLEVGKSYGSKTSESGLTYPVKYKDGELTIHELPTGDIGISNVYVKNKGTGTGTEMMTKAIDYIKTKYPNKNITLYPENSRNRAFYKKFDFEDTAETMTLKSKPKPTPPIPESKIAEGVKILEEDPIFEKGNHKEYTRVFLETLAKDPELALDIALGKKPAPKGGTQASFAKLMGNAEFNPNLTVEQIMRLTEKPVTVSLAGQELESSKLGAGELSIVDAVKEINKIKKENLGKINMKERVINTIKKFQC